MSLLELFCKIDDFCQIYEAIWQPRVLETGQRQCQRACQMKLSEMMTLVVHFHQKRYREFKIYYTEYVSQQLRGEFPSC